jgi:hypothetical protein
VKSMTHMARCVLLARIVCVTE